MKLGGIPYWNKTFRKDLWTLSNAFFYNNSANPRAVIGRELWSIIV